MAGEQARLDHMLGKYRVTRLLGRGAYGTVVEAIDKELGRKVALKILEPGLLRDPAFIQNYVQQEARTLAQLQHPNIVRILEVGRDQGTTYLVLEYIDGQTLDQWVQEKKPSLEEQLRVLQQVANALDFAHTKGVIHRDLKPSNILIDGDGNAHLTDFGLAHAAMTSAKGTSSTVPLGTAVYMSPEQAAEQDCDARSDLYSLGVIVYELFAGRPPFEAKTVLGYIRAHADQQPPPPAEFNRGISRDVQDVILQALEKPPDKRFQSAGVFVRALRTATQRPYRRAEINAAPAVTAKATASPPPQQPATEPSTPPPQVAKRRKASPLLRVSVALLLGIACLAAVLLVTYVRGMWSTDDLPFLSASTPTGEAEATSAQTPTGPIAGTIPTDVPPLPPTETSTPTEAPTSAAMPTDTAAPVPTDTPPPTQTPAPSPTPPPAPISVSSVPLLFQDDFSDPNRGWKQHLNFSDKRMEYRDGTLQIRTVSQDTYNRVYAYPGLRLQDFVLEVDAQNLTDVPSARVGVMFRAVYESSYGSDYSKYYLYTIGNDGACELRIYDTRFHGTDDSATLLVPPVVLESVDRFGGVNRIHIEAVGGHFRIFVNGQLAIEFEHTDYREYANEDFSVGDIGLYVEDPNRAGITVGFDNLVIGLLQE